MRSTRLWGPVLTLVMGFAGVAFTVGEYRNQTLAIWLFVLAGVVLGAWLLSLLVHRFRGDRPRLAFEIEMGSLPELTVEEPRSPRVALLRVTNVSREDIANLVAQLSYRRNIPDEEETEWTEDGCWSRETGREYVQGGGHRADLTAGDSCLLPVAIAFEDRRVWGGVNPDVLGRPPALSGSGHILPMVSGAEDVTIGTEGRVSVELRAAGVGTVVLEVALGFAEHLRSGHAEANPRII